MILFLLNISKEKLDILDNVQLAAYIPYTSKMYMTLGLACLLSVISVLEHWFICANLVVTYSAVARALYCKPLLVWV